MKKYIDQGTVEIILKRQNKDKQFSKKIFNDLVYSENCSINRLFLDDKKILEKDRI